MSAPIPEKLPTPEQFAVWVAEAQEAISRMESFSKHALRNATPQDAYTAGYISGRHISHLRAQEGGKS